MVHACGHVPPRFQRRTLSRGMPHLRMAMGVRLPFALSMAHSHSSPQGVRLAFAVQPYSIRLAFAPRSMGAGGGRDHGVRLAFALRMPHSIIAMT